MCVLFRNSSDSGCEEICHQGHCDLNGMVMVIQPELAREAAYSVGRYGHVMFPENVHEPALHCAELLLQGVGQGWAERVFFSDNGSTSIEVAIKMAFRKYATDHGLCDPADSEHGKQQFEVLPCILCKMSAGWNRRS
jgi:hypothetical protein